MEIVILDSINTKLCILESMNSKIYHFGEYEFENSTFLRV